MEINQVIHYVLVSLLVVVAGIIGINIAKLVNKLIEYVRSKCDSQTFSSAMEVAKGIYIYLEDKYTMSGMGETKKVEMEEMLLEKFPNLTKVELDSINKAVWESFNKEYSNNENLRLNG